MNNQFKAIYEQTTLREICSNAKEVLSNINKEYPQETYGSLATRAAVNTQTIQRWSSNGRADADAIRRLIKSFSNNNIEDVLLKNATPQQLYKRCSEIGWDKVIQSNPKGDK